MTKGNVGKTIFIIALNFESEKFLPK